MKRYPWRRFWCPRDGAFSLSDDGFLYDPESEFGEMVNPAVRPFDGISGRPCLVLLGEPGSGKSVALEDEAMARERAGALVRRIDLREYSQESSLRSLVSEPWFRGWEGGSERLELFLDSFDECRIRIPNLVALLAALLRSHSDRSNRLWLRIACRTTEWPETLTPVLSAVWGDAQVGIYELVPLRKKDVAAAVVAQGLDGDGFIRSVQERGVQALAIRPVTLDLLLKKYNNEQQLPDRLVDVYEQGLRLLCEETQQRVEAGLRPDLRSRDRMAIASRVAAALVLGNRAAVYAGPDRGDVPPEDALLDDLVGGSESADGEEIPVSDRALRDVLGTGLVSSRGAFRFGFSHQTYAEFLAARYLVAHGFTAKRIYSLVAVPGERELQIAPQLQETVAWLASLREDVFEELLSQQPEILLRSDVTTRDPELCRSLVANILNRIRTRALFEWRELYRFFGKLDHPGLAEQLAPVIRARREPPEVRSAAIDIAEQCRRGDLGAFLADVALDQHENLRARVDAAHAVVRIGESESAARLRPLALGEGEEDPDDELRGCGLGACWPKHLSARELFSSLSHPKNPRLFGAYKYFLMRGRFLDDLAPADLGSALEWLIARDFGHDPLDPFREVANKIVCLAWRDISVPEVRDRLALVVAKAIRNHVDLDFWQGDRAESFKKLLVEDPGRRRVLLEAMVVAAPNEERMMDLVYLQPPLATEEDFAWLVERAREKGDREAKKWVELARFTFNPANRIHVERLYLGRRECPSLDAALAQSFPESVEIGSPIAAEMRRLYEERKRFDERIRSMKPKLVDPPPVERVRMALDRCLGGEPEQWKALCFELSLTPTSDYYPSLWDLDITRLPGWVEATHDTRQRVVHAAKVFLQAHTPTPAEWVGTDKVTTADYAGLSALALLLQLDPPFVTNLSADQWSGWGPVILGAPDVGIDSELVQTLAQTAYHRSPTAFSNALVHLIEIENDRHDHLFVIRRATKCWNGTLPGIVLDILRRGALKPRAMGTLLDAAMEGGVSEVEELAAGLGRAPAPGANDDRDRSIEAARSLLLHGKGDVWPMMSAGMIADPDWGRTVLQRTCEESHDSGFLVRLDERQLGELLGWLYAHCPPSSDPKREGGFVGPAEMIRDLRDRCMQVLVSRGSWAAVGELERLREGQKEAFQR